MSMSQLFLLHSVFIMLQSFDFSINLDLFGVLYLHFRVYILSFDTVSQASKTEMELY